MIIFRKLLQKLFRRDEMPDEKFEINKEEYLKEKYGIDKIKIDFLNTKKYDTDWHQVFTERETIKKA